MLQTKLFHSRGPKASDFSRFALIGFVCLAFFSQSFAVAAKYGALSCKNGHIVNAAGQNVQLKGMSMYAWTPAAINFYNASAIGHLAQDWKCTAIRIPYMSSGSVSMDKLNTVLQACVDNGIYGIVDWHGGNNNDVASPTKFFQTVATKWHTVPNIMYEPQNEPTVAWSAIKPYMQTVIAAIRAIDPTNIILCGDPQWDQKPQDAAADPITGYTNIGYTMHFYAASHSCAGYSPGIVTAMGKGCAIFITEYGTCNASGHAPLNMAETQKWWTFLDANSIGSTNWGVEAEDIDGAAAFTKAASSTGPWADNVLNGDATQVRAYIMKDIPGQPVGIIPNEFQLQPKADAPTIENMLTGAYSKSGAVYSINGVRCQTGAQLHNGLYVFQVKGITNVKCLVK
jgi:endoglucanase